MTGPASDVTLVVGFPPNASYGQIGGILAKHLGRYLPGNPKVSVRNMPGDASLTAARYLCTEAPTDGSVIGLLARTVATEPLLSDRDLGFDSRKLRWLGSPAREVSVAFAWHETPFKTIDDARHAVMITTATSPNAGSAIFAYILNDVAKTKFSVIAGYPDAKAMMAAVESGVAHGIVGPSLINLNSTRPDWLRTGKARVLVQFAAKPDPELTDVPLVMELAQDQEERNIIELIFAPQDFAYPLVAPPTTPSAVIKQLSTALLRTARDEGFLCEARQAQFAIDPLSGVEIETLLGRLYGTDKRIVARAKTAIAEGARAAKSYAPS